MRCPTCLLILGVVGVACALKVCQILCPQPVGLPEPAGLVCTINGGDRLDTYNWQLYMATLSMIGIGYDDVLAVQAQQVAPWVVPWVAQPVGLDCVVHGCGGPPDVRA